MLNIIEEMLIVLVRRLGKGRGRGVRAQEYQ